VSPVNARAAFRINGREPVPGTLAVRREVVYLATLGPRADKDWTYRDQAGHFHAFSTADERYPTLFEEDIVCDSPHLDGDDWWCECRTEYTCRICKAVVIPGMVAGPHQEAHPGLMTWEVLLGLETSMPLPWEVGAMVTVEANLPGSTQFGVAVFTSIVTEQGFGDRVNVKAVLEGAGALGERRK
jgi:hypothetical protein